MTLAIKVDSLEGMDEATQALYVADGNGYALDVSGIDGLESALKKERTSKKVAALELERLKSLYDGIDPNEARELKKQSEKKVNEKLSADELAEKKLKKLRDSWEKEKTGINSELGVFKKKAMENIFRTVASASGVHQAAIDDILLRGQSIFTLNGDGQAVQLDAEGQPVLGADGKSEFSPAEWLEGMRDAAPHWWPAANSGGGARGSAGKAGQAYIEDPVERLNAARGVQN